MTLPNGADGVDQTEWGITGDPAGGDTAASLAGRDQATVQEQLKQQKILESPGWQASKNGVFAQQGLTGSLGLSGGLVKALLQKLTGMPLSVTTGGLPDILQLFLGIPAAQIVSGATRNLLLNPQFTLGLLSWAPTGTSDLFAWAADLTEGNAVPGAAKITANGTLRSLVSESIWVQPGDTVALSGFRKFSGGTATGTPVKLVLEAQNLIGGVVSSTVIGTATGSGTSGWTQITGSSYTVPGSGVSWVRAKLMVDTAMTAGTVWFDDIVLTKSGALSAAVLPNIAPGDGPGQSSELLVVNDGWTNFLAMIGLTPPQAQVDTSSAALPAVNVGGVQGVQTLDETFKTMFDQWVAAFRLLTPTAGSTLPQVSSAAQTVAQQAQDSHTLAVDNANILGFRNNAPTAVGFDDTSESNMLVTDIVASTTSVYALSGGGSDVPAAVIRCEKSGPKGAVSFVADKQASTSFYVVIYKINFVTGALEFQHRSANIIASLPTSGLDWVRYSFAGTPVNVVMGNVLVVMFQSNSGSKVFGAPYTLKAHPTANMASIGASVNPAALPAGTGNITAANWHFLVANTFGGGTTVIPYAAVEIVDVPPDYHNPDKAEFLTAGSYSYVIPAWAKFVDLIAVGGGNRGDVFAGGGQSGTWAHTTLTLPTGGGVAAGNTLDVVVGAGGTSTPTNGLASTVKKGATSLLSAAGSSAFTGNDSGSGPGDHRYLSTTYFGGTAVWFDTNGSVPGGGGGKTLNPALHGGNGGVWIVARQT